MGELAASLVKSLADYDGELWKTKVPFILIFAFLLVYPVIQKELKEITVVSATLFVGVGIMIVTLGYQLIFDGLKYNSDDDITIYYSS